MDTKTKRRQVGAKMLAIVAYVKAHPGQTMYEIATGMLPISGLVASYDQEQRAKTYRAIDRCIEYGLVAADLRGRSTVAKRELSKLYPVETE
jgi:hypothetical protein